MKLLLLLALSLPLSAQTYVNPVRVQILKAHFTQGIVGHGSGQGNLYDLNLGMRGFDYVSTLCGKFQESQGADRYSARWTAKQRLILVTQPIGSSRTQECLLETTLRDFVYVEAKDGRLTTAPIGGKHAQ